jgi:hypothetical protein
MSRVIIKFSNGDGVNLEADCIDTRDSWLIAWKSEDIVAIVRLELIDACYLSKQKEDNNGRK